MNYTYIGEKQVERMFDERVYPHGGFIYITSKNRVEIITGIPLPVWKI
jgi:hypothetical protein